MKRALGLFVYPDPQASHWQRWHRLYLFVAGVIAAVLLVWYLVDDVT